jgi:hypothetical protein
MWVEVSAASAAFFRIAFGLAMIVNAALYVPVLVDRYYVAPSYTFGYPWFEWVHPAPAIGMYAVYAAMMMCGALIAVGLWYRWALGIFFLLTTYVFLLDTTHYQNHEYLISLVALLMLLMPLDRYWSLDARRRPEIARATVPVWVVWMLRFQIGVPYVFGGIAKLNGDWFRGEPLRMWLAARTELEPLHSLLTDSSVVWFMTYGALVLDLVAVPLLLWRRTRVPIFVLIVTFHLMNVWLFGLFIFPWLMIAATTVYFDPDWPLRLVTRLPARWRPWWGRRPAGASGTGSPHHPAVPAGGSPPRWGAALAAFLAVWIAVQLLVPLRHLAVPGNVSWTEEGHRFAWHMMLRSKTGTVVYEVDTGDAVFVVEPAEHLTPDQATDLVGDPQRLAQFAHHLSSLHGGAEVRAITAVSFNGRRPEPIVDPDVDLAAVPTAWIGHQDWILPSTEPLRRP